MKKLAIIGAGRAAVDYAENAKRIGVETYCFAWKQGALAEKVVDHFFDISIFEKERIVEICKENGISGVVATTELTVEVAAYIAEKLKLNGISFEVAKVITDKYRNRSVTRNVEGLHHPAFAKINTQAEIEKLNFSFPIILKPVNRGGKRGVTVIKDKDAIESAFQYAIQETEKNSDYIVEEYIEGGQEYSVESLSFHGNHYIIQVTQKISSGPPHCVELGHQQPAEMSREMRSEVEDVLKRSLTAVGVMNGPCHTEIKIRDGRIYLIEFNARPGGDRISGTLTELSTGYPYFVGMIQVALDELPEIETSKFQNRHAAIYFLTEQTKELETIFNNCQKFDWCYEKHIVSNSQHTLMHNDSMQTNYFIALSDRKLDF